MKPTRRKSKSKAAHPKRVWTPGLRPKAVVGVFVSAATLFCLLWIFPSSALGATDQNLHLPTPKNPARVLVLEEDRPETVRAMCSRVKSHLLDSDMPFKMVIVSPAGIQTCWTDQRTTWTHFREVRSVGIRYMTLKDPDNPVFEVGNQGAGAQGAGCDRLRKREDRPLIYRRVGFPAASERPHLRCPGRPGR